jgi:hypothetical protein
MPLKITRQAPAEIHDEKIKLRPVCHRYTAV